MVARQHVELREQSVRHRQLAASRLAFEYLERRMGVLEGSLRVTPLPEDQPQLAVDAADLVPETGLLVQPLGLTPVVQVEIGVAERVRGVAELLVQLRPLPRRIRFRQVQGDLVVADGLAVGVYTPSPVAGQPRVLRRSVQLPGLQAVVGELVDNITKFVSVLILQYLKHFAVLAPPVAPQHVAVHRVAY